MTPPAVERLRGRLVVSCQPVVGGPMDRDDIVVAFALAALAGGAAGLRIEGVERVRAVRRATDAPVIGLVKRDLDASPVRITPTAALARALAEAGADVVAFDATDRARPEGVVDPVGALVEAIHAAGAASMADCASEADMRRVLGAGADLVGTTLSGYDGGPVPEGPDLDLVAAGRALTPHVVAEGRIGTPADAAAAMERGAFCVVVGSAITRTELLTAAFARALPPRDG